MMFLFGVYFVLFLFDIVFCDDSKRQTRIKREGGFDWWDLVNIADWSKTAWDAFKGRGVGLPLPSCSTIVCQQRCSSGADHSWCRAHPKCCYGRCVGGAQNDPYGRHFRNGDTCQCFSQC